MTHRFYPLFVDLIGKKCLVVGGGRVGERKVRGVLEAGGKVLVVSPSLTSELQALNKSGAIECIQEKFREQHLHNVFLAFAATNDPKENKKIWQAASKINILVSVADDPALCSFITPAVVEQGDLLIAVSTGGKSPALAAQVRCDLQEKYGDEYKEFLDLLGDLRKGIVTQVSKKNRKKVFESLVKSNIIDLLKQKERQKAVTTAEEIITAYT